MPITRKLLKGMGLTEEQVDTIIEAHTDTVDSLKDQIAEYKADAEKLTGVQAELDKAKKTIADGNKDSWKVKYDAMKEDFDKYKSEQMAKESKAAKETAYRALLKSAGVSEKRIDSVMRVSDIDDIELDENGTVKDAETLTNSIKDEWADFIVSTGTKGANTDTPPSNNDGAKTHEEIYKKDDKGRYVLTTAERQKALAEQMAQNE